MQSSSPFLCGVVEGFYGRPWNARQRHQLFGWMRQWGMTSYVYAPKDDLKHRRHWRELYIETELAEFAAVVRDCQRQGLQFIYAISPGLDMRHGSMEDQDSLKRKLTQILDTGCRDFALLCDDIPPTMDPADRGRFGSLAEAHCHTANETWNFIQTKASGSKLFFCPTPYCGVMAEKQPDYLPTLGALLHPAIEVFWTGPHVISREIPVDSIRAVQADLKRKPILWDNLHANDYDLQGVFLGPFSGRPLELRNEVGGILTNPNCQFELNFVPLRTLAMYAAAKTENWSPRAAYLAAQAEWQNFFGNGDDLITSSDLELLGDCFYLPEELGDRAQHLVNDCECVLAANDAEFAEARARVMATARQVAELVRKFETLPNRELLFAFYPFIWALRAELDLTVAAMNWRGKSDEREPFVSPERELGINRGGFLERLRALTNKLG